MSKGSEKHPVRFSELNEFGKDLARRSKSHCELCQAHGVKLVIHEVPPVPKEPSFDHCIFICEACLQHMKKNDDSSLNHWHCLHTSIWSDVAAVQVMAILLAHQVAEQGNFAESLLEQVYLQPPIQNWVEQALSAQNTKKK